MVTYQITLAVSLVDEVAGIAPATVAKGIPTPLVVRAIIAFHQLLKIIDVHVFRSQAWRWTKGIFEADYEFVKSITLARTDVGNATVVDDRRVGEDANSHVCLGWMLCLSTNNWFSLTWNYSKVKRNLARKKTTRLLIIYQTAGRGVHYVCGRPCLIAMGQIRALTKRQIVSPHLGVGRGLLSTSSHGRNRPTELGLGRRALSRRSKPGPVSWFQGVGWVQRR